MKVYFAKTWAFNNPAWPLAFGMNGNRNKVRERLEDGDWVVLIGTMNENTQKEERGRLLGILEPLKENVHTLDFDGIDKGNEKFHNDKGEFKWPYALHSRRAWLLIDRPTLKEIASEENYKKYNAGILQPSVASVDLFSDEEAEKVKALEKKEIGLLPLTANAAEILERKHGNLSTRHTAPPPSTTRRGVMHMRQSQAYTYMLKIKGASTPCFKIGWAFDWEARMKKFNHASMPNIGGVEYTTCRHHKWHTAKQAYKMEQWILKELNENRHSDNNEIITGIEEKELLRVWIKAISIF